MAGCSAYRLLTTMAAVPAPQSDLHNRGEKLLFQKSRLSTASQMRRQSHVAKKGPGSAVPAVQPGDEHCLRAGRELLPSSRHPSFFSVLTCKRSHRFLHARNGYRTEDAKRVYPRIRFMSKIASTCRSSDRGFRACADLIRGERWLACYSSSCTKPRLELNLRRRQLNKEPAPAPCSTARSSMFTTSIFVQEEHMTYVETFGSKSRA